MQQTATAPSFINVRVKSLNPFAHYAFGLRFTHESLRRNLRTIMKIAEANEDHSDRFLEFTTLYIQSLTDHHRVEDAITFPAISRGALLGSSGGTLFETFNNDHISVHRLLEDLAQAVDRAGVSSQRSLKTIHQISSNLNEALLPHLDLEESSLTPENLSHMLTPAAMSEAEKRALAEHRKGGSALLMLYIHSLTDEEQRVLFGEEPWFFRTVLLRWTWRRSFDKFLQYAFNSNLAL